MIYQETIRWRGAPIATDAIRAENKVFIISGRLLKTASLKDELSRLKERLQESTQRGK